MFAKEIVSRDWAQLQRPVSWAARHDVSGASRHWVTAHPGACNIFSHARRASEIGASQSWHCAQNWRLPQAVAGAEGVPEPFRVVESVLERASKSRLAYVLDNDCATIVATSQRVQDGENTDVGLRDANGPLKCSRAERPY
ncbi:hypothetical protein GGX14DRAFT_389624 [Mycena pura]|uniref:Uncharacterized protein n=1 Tax=Mycena pura TaxID=153505 RepID=A0AAD6YIS1_9AGAR|nr:hypothetical protein GGX14DRAFT_389624 [Mycena pura]